METVDLFLARPFALFVVLALGAAIGIAIERTSTHLEKARLQAFWRQRKASFKSRHARNGRGGASRNKPSDPVDFATQQLAAVMRAKFAGKPVFNASELRLFRLIETCLAQARPKWRVMGQVSLGEILGSADKDAFFAINSKRVDLLIMDESSRPIHVIEFQGSGHHLGKTAAARDAVKKEALRRADIGYAEVMPGDTPGQIRAMIASLAPAIAA